MDLTDRVAIVTGASRGMGEQIALQLAAAGARLSLVGREPASLLPVAESITAAGGRAIAIPSDIRSNEQVESMAAKTLQHYGRIDILVNCAFWGPPASIEETTESLWDQTLDTSLKGPFLSARAVVPAMKRQGGGRIVNIGSKAGKIGEDNRTAYCAAKWGLEGLTAALVEELTRYNIHVHLISPAATDTPFWRDAGANLTPTVLERMIGWSAARRSSK